MLDMKWPEYQASSFCESRTEYLEDVGAHGSKSKSFCFIPDYEPAGSCEDFSLRSRHCHCSSVSKSTASCSGDTAPSVRPPFRERRVITVWVLATKTLPSAWYARGSC